MSNIQTSTTTHENPLGCAPIGKLLSAFALPAVVSMLVNAVYNIVDQIFIGQGVGYIGNAATTVAFPIVTIILAVGTLLGSGGSAFASIRLGEKKEKEAEHSLGNVFFLSLVIGILLMVLGLVFLTPLLNLFGATPKNFAYSRDYAFILFLGTPFNLLSISLSNMARTDGNPKLAMYSMLAGAILNTILDPIYIFVFHWGVRGAAIATITSQIISSVILTVYFFRSSQMRIHKESLKLDKTICCSLVTLGMSSGITQITATIMQIVMNNSLVYYGKLSTVGGDVALSAMGIVMKISMIVVSVCVGISIGSQPIIGFNRGANQWVRVKKTYLTAVSIATAFSFLGWAICMLFPQAVLSIFGTQDPTFAAFSEKCVRIFLGALFCVGFQIVSTTYFQATGQPLKASLLSMLRQLLLLIPLVLILPFFFGLDGILYAGVIADSISGILVAFFIFPEMRRLTKMVSGNQTKPSKRTEVLSD